MKKEETYNYILSYLLDEGYVETQSSAEKVMMSMSEEWMKSILSEMPFEVHGPPKNAPSDAPKVKIGKTHQTLKSARRSKDRYDERDGGTTHVIVRVP